MSTRVLVSVGTHEQPFQRLLDGVAATIRLHPDVKFVVQYGVGKWADLPNVEAVDYFDHHEMQLQLRAADILVSQASPGNVFGALEASTWPLVLGRSKGFNEHVDDHQIHFASAVHEMGLGANLVDIERLAPALSDELTCVADQRMARCEHAKSESEKRAEVFHAQFWKNIDYLMSDSHV